jgi:hypothetical protein
VDPPGIVALTALLNVSIQEMVLSASFVTYAEVPFGAIATPEAALPTGIVATTVFVSVLTTETLPGLEPPGQKGLVLLALFTT